MQHDGRTTICFPFVGDTVGGSHLSVRGLIDGLDPARFRVIIVPQCPDGAIARLFADAERIAGPRLPGQHFAPGERFNPVKMARAFSAIVPQIRFLRRYRVDIVHTNDGATHASWGLPARLSGARLLWHHRGDPDALGLRTVAPVLANRVLAVSGFSMPPPGLWSAARKAEVLHSPFDVNVRVDRTAARAQLLCELGLPDDTLLLGYFGSFIARKRPFLFADGIARLQMLLPDRPVAGVMFGTADDAAVGQALERRIAQPDVGGSIRLMGYRTPGAFWIAACDQLVVPAIQEPFGRTLVEAMLVGTPVVAARSGGNPEALRDGALGLLVEPEDADALAKGCAWLARNPLDAGQFVLRAQADAHGRFGEARHRARVSEIYDELVGRRAA